MTISTQNSPQFSIQNFGHSAANSAMPGSTGIPAPDSIRCKLSPSLHNCPGIPQCSGESALDYWQRHSSARMPGTLATIAQQCSWQDFLANFMPGAHASWQLIAAQQDGIGTQHCTFQVGALQLQASGTGPIAACSQLLANQGRSIEITAFHPFRFSQQHCLIMQGKRTKEARWAIAFGSSAEQAACSALSYIASCLYPHA